MSARALDRVELWKLTHGKRAGSGNRCRNPWRRRYVRSRRGTSNRLPSPGTRVIQNNHSTDIEARHTRGIAQIDSRTR